MSAATLVLPAVLGGVAAGILAADSAGLPVLPLLGGGGTLVAIGLTAGWRSALLIGVALTAFGLGAWRGEASTADAATSVATLVDGQDHELLGTVVDDPRPREDRVQLVLGDLAIARDGVAHRLSTGCSCGCRGASMPAPAIGSSWFRAWSWRRTSTDSRIASTWNARASVRSRALARPRSSPRHPDLPPCLPGCAGRCSVG